MIFEMVVFSLQHSTQLQVIKLLLEDKLWQVKVTLPNNPRGGNETFFYFLLNL